VDFIQQSLIDPISRILWNYVLIYVLIGAGVWFTLRTRFVQVRLFPEMVRTILGSRGGSEGGISSFQAFAVGLASRVGTGNIAGVAIALTLGGPGAVFWMWVVAAVGMATGFVEATLAQLYKVKWPDGSFRGGPAYYIQNGLGSRRWGMVFAVLLVFTFGVAFNMVQSNTIADVLASAHTVDQRWSALVLAALTAPVVSTAASAAGSSIAAGSADFSSLSTAGLSGAASMAVSGGSAAVGTSGAVAAAGTSGTVIAGPGRCVAA